MKLGSVMISYAFKNTISAWCPVTSPKINLPFAPEAGSRVSDRSSNKGTHLSCFSFIKLAACKVLKSFQKTSHLIWSPKKPGSNSFKRALDYHPTWTLCSQHSGLLVLPTICDIRQGGRALGFQDRSALESVFCLCMRCELSIFKDNPKT